MKRKLKVNLKIAYDKEGKKSGIMLSYSEYQALIEQLEDLYDVYSAYKVTSKKFKTISHEELKKELFGDDICK